MMSCLWNGIAFAATLRTYTLGPLIIVCMLGMPVGAAHFRRLHIIARGRYRETVDRFWTNSMFVAFALYPALAMTSMSVLNCDPNVGRLRDDYRVVCPNAMDPLSVYSYCFMLLYCLGIPVVMHVALRVAGIKIVVQSKIQAAEFQAMMGLFMKLYVSIELARFARLVGNVDDDEVEFEREAKREFNKLLVVQGNGTDELDLEILESAAAGTQGMGMEGTSLKSIVKCLEQYDTNDAEVIVVDELHRRGGRLGCHRAQPKGHHRQEGRARERVHPSIATPTKVVYSNSINHSMVTCH